MMPPKQVPDNSEHSKGDFENWQDFHREGEATEFHYSDSTKDHIENGETQHFHYEGNDLPEKE